MGLCRSCAIARVGANLEGLDTKRGPFARHWAAQLAASVGYGPLDDLPPKP